MLRRAIGALTLLLGVATLAWSAWLYHFAGRADTTDESVTFWVVTGTILLGVGCLLIFIGLRYLRRAR